jgi:cytochrome c2
MEIRRRVIRGAALLGMLALSACGTRVDERAFAEAAALTGGDPKAGRTKARKLGCGSCHTIPGVFGARSQVGPPLKGMRGRPNIGGVLANTPENMVRWIQDPKSVDSTTSMPGVGASERDARDIAAYLYAIP